MNSTYNKEYYQKNKEKELKRHKDWAKKNKDRLKEYQCEYRRKKALLKYKKKKKIKAIKKGKIKKRYVIVNKKLIPVKEP